MQYHIKFVYRNIALFKPGSVLVQVTFCNICDLLVSFKSKTLLVTMEGLYRGLMAGIRSMTINIPGTAFHHALIVSSILMNFLIEIIMR